MSFHTVEELNTQKVKAREVAINNLVLAITTNPENKIIIRDAVEDFMDNFMTEILLRVWNNQLIEK